MNLWRVPASLYIMNPCNSHLQLLPTLYMATIFEFEFKTLAKMQLSSFHIASDWRSPVDGSAFHRLAKTLFQQGMPRDSL